MTSNAQPALAWYARKRHCSGCLSGGGEIRKLTARARVSRWLRSAYALQKEYCTGKKASLFRSKTPWCDVRAEADSNAQPAFAWHTRARHCAGYLSGCGETRDLAARARRAELAVIGLRAMEECCAGKKPPLSWCKTVVRRASCGLQHAAGIRVAHTHAPLRWLSLGMWRNTRPCRTRAVPRWL